MGYCKPTREDLQLQSVQDALRDHFQLAVDDVLATLLVPVSPASQVRPRAEGAAADAHAEAPPATQRRLAQGQVAAEALAAGMDVGEGELAGTCSLLSAASRGTPRDPASPRPGSGGGRGTCCWHGRGRVSAAFHMSSASSVCAREAADAR